MGFRRHARQTGREDWDKDGDTFQVALMTNVTLSHHVTHVTTSTTIDQRGMARRRDKVLPSMSRLPGRAVCSRSDEVW